MIMTKRTSKMQPGFPAQRGYAMLAIIAVLGVAATTVVVTSLSATAVHNEQNRKTSSALALAKQALIASAASSSTRPGSLPCPDINNDGISEIPVAGACPSLIGRLPWQTLGLPDLRDSSGERLWYALSQQFRDAPGNIVNSTTTGQLSITGTITEEQLAAIVFAPGAPLNEQRRDTDERRNSVSQYVEGYVNATTFSASAAGATYNDQLISISASDIFAVTQRRVAKEVQVALNAYFTLNGGYPVPALATNSACLSGDSTSCTSATGTSGLLPSDPSPAPAYTGGASLLAHSVLAEDASNWFDKNNWRSLVQYQVSPDCVMPSASCVGTLTVNGIPNQKAAVALNVVPPANQSVSAIYSMSMQQ